MVWCALAYASLGSWLTWRVGRPLVRLNGERYAPRGRAALRAGPRQRARRGHRAPRRRGGRAPLARPGRSSAWWRSRGASPAARPRLTWITSGYGWLALVVPIVVAAPGYFAGELSFGGLMMVVGAFNQVQSSLRWFVDNFAADRRLARHAAARRDLPRGAARPRGARRRAPAASTLVEHGGRERSSSRTSRSPCRTGALTLDRAAVEVAPGERVSILGKPAAGKSTLFRALAGLWPCGGGHDPAAAARRDRVHDRSAPTCRPARCAPPSPTRRSPTRFDGRRGARRARAGRPRPPRAVARPRGPLGPELSLGRAAAAGLRPRCCCTRRAG